MESNVGVKGEGQEGLSQSFVQDVSLKGLMLQVRPEGDDICLSEIHDGDEGYTSAILEENGDKGDSNESLNTTDTCSYRPGDIIPGLSETDIQVSALVNPYEKLMIDPKQMMIDSNCVSDDSDTINGDSDTSDNESSGQLVIDDSSQIKKQPGDWDIYNEGSGDKESSDQDDIGRHEHINYTADRGCATEHVDEVADCHGNENLSSDMVGSEISDPDKDNMSEHNVQPIQSGRAGPVKENEGKQQIDVDVPIHVLPEGDTMSRGQQIIIYGTSERMEEELPDSARYCETMQTVAETDIVNKVDQCISGKVLTPELVPEVSTMTALEVIDDMPVIKEEEGNQDEENWKVLHYHEDICEDPLNMENIQVSDGEENHEIHHISKDVIITEIYAEETENMEGCLQNATTHLDGEKDQESVSDAEDKDATNGDIPQDVTKRDTPQDDTKGDTPQDVTNGDTPQEDVTDGNIPQDVTNDENPQSDTNNANPHDDIDEVAIGNPDTCLKATDEETSGYAKVEPTSVGEEEGMERIIEADVGLQAENNTEKDNFEQKDIESPDITVEDLLNDSIEKQVVSEEDNGDIEIVVETGHEVQSEAIKPDVGDHTRNVKDGGIADVDVILAIDKHKEKIEIQNEPIEIAKDALTVPAKEAEECKADEEGKEAKEGENGVSNDMIRNEGGDNISASSESDLDQSTMDMTDYYTQSGKKELASENEAAEVDGKEDREGNMVTKQEDESHDKEEGLTQEEEEDSEVMKLKEEISKKASLIGSRKRQKIDGYPGGSLDRKKTTKQVNGDLVDGAPARNGIAGKDDMALLYSTDSNQPESRASVTMVRTLLLLLFLLFSLGICQQL